MFKFNKLLIIFLSASIIACNKESYAPAKNLFLNFYPLKKGSVVIYDVDSLAYNNFTNSSTRYLFELKDSTTNTYLNNTDTIYIIERYKRNKGELNWIFQKTITRNATSRSAQENIDNKRFVRLNFPPLAGAKWNGNSFNDLGEQTYEVNEAMMSLTVNNFNFDSVVNVIQIDETNLIREDKAIETYAKNYGLVKKEVTALDKNINTQKITNGFIYSMKIKRFN